MHADSNSFKMSNACGRTIFAPAVIKSSFLKMTGQDACSQCAGISTGFNIQGMIADHHRSVGAAAQS